MTDNKKLREIAIEAAKNSYSIYSKAKIGCALQTSSNKYYSGCNIENGSYGATVCAERVAIWNAVSQGERELKMIYIYSKDGWPPCGMCRQVMTEFATPELEIIIGDKEGNEKSYRLKELFPLAFTPDHLK